MDSYDEKLEWLFKQLPMFSRVGAPAYKPGLDTSFNLAALFDNPQRKFKSIHIGGTNGKGSVSHMIASVLQEHGLKTGLYTSPHLVDFRERMRINGEMIPKAKVMEFIDRWRESDYNFSPSFFELTMMMAFDWFAKEKVDIAVIEVGMGGRLDSTNIITPCLSVITNISKDHTQFLGETLEKIAGEKAGIIKPAIPVVVGESGVNGVKEVFLNKADETRSEIIFADTFSNDYEVISEGCDIKVKLRDKEIHLPLHGDYQKKNVKTVLTALKKLNELGFDLSDGEIKEGIENVESNTGLKGRWMKISDGPLTIADTGHNEAGISFNMNQLEKLRKEKGSQLHIVIGFVADKAIDDIIELLPKDAIYYVTNAKIPRALDHTVLYNKLYERGFKNLIDCNSVSSAYAQAKSDASPADIIFIGGSTFIVADFLSNKF